MRVPVGMCKTIVHLLMWSKMTPEGERPLKAGFEDVRSLAHAIS